MFDINCTQARPGVEVQKLRRSVEDSLPCLTRAKLSLSVKKILLRPESHGAHVQYCIRSLLRTPMDPFAWCLVFERKRRLWQACHITRNDALPPSDINRLQHRPGLGGALQVACRALSHATGRQVPVICHTCCSGF